MATNRRQLVLDAFHNVETERLPVGFWFHFAQGREVFEGLEKPAIIRKNIDGHLKFFREFGPDFMKLMSDGFFGHPDGSIGEAQHAGELRSVRPAGKKSPWIEKQVELAKTLTGNFGAEVMTFYNVFSPATTLKFLFGDGAAGNRKLEAFIAEDPDAVRHAIDVLAGDLADLAERVIGEGGADGIYLSVQDVRVSADVYRKIIAPGEGAVLARANAAKGKNILHICGYEGFRNDLSRFADYDAQAFNWAVTTEGVSLAEGKKLFGGKAVIGGFANGRGDILHSGSKKEIEAYTAHLVAESGTRGIMLGADCTLPADIDIERLKWVRACAKAQTYNGGKPV